MSIASRKVPAVLVSGIICLMLGIGGGVVLGAFVDTGLNKQAAANPGETDEGKAPPAKGGMMPPGGGKAGAKGGGKGGGGKGGGGGAKGKGGGASGPKTQLTELVGKLDSLTRKPLTVQLTADQKKQVKDLLADLDSKDAITDDEAKAKLDAFLKLLEGQRETLVAAGFRWPGGPPSPPNDPINPFKSGEPAGQLRSLRESMDH